MGAFYIIDDGFHIENNGNIGAGMAFCNILVMELTGSVDHQLLFPNRIFLSVYLCHQLAPIHVGQLKIAMSLALEGVARIPDIVVIAENLADTHAGENPTEHIGSGKCLQRVAVVCSGNHFAGNIGSDGDEIPVQSGFQPYIAVDGKLFQFRSVKGLAYHKGSHAALQLQADLAVEMIDLIEAALGNQM